MNDRLSFVLRRQVLMWILVQHTSFYAKVFRWVSLAMSLVTPILAFAQNYTTHHGLITTTVISGVLVSILTKAREILPHIRLKRSGHSLRRRYNEIEMMITNGENDDLIDSEIKYAMEEEPDIPSGVRKSYQKFLKEQGLAENPIIERLIAVEKPPVVEVKVDLQRINQTMHRLHDAAPGLVAFDN